MKYTFATALLVGAALSPTLLPGGAIAYSERSVGTPEQVAWVRHAAERFVGAELQGNAPEACAVLNAPLRATRHGRTCEQRLSARIAAARREHGMWASLRAERRAATSARVVVTGNVASIELPEPLLHQAEPLPLDRKLLDARGLSRRRRGPQRPFPRAEFPDLGLGFRLFSRWSLAIWAWNSRLDSSSARSVSLETVFSSLCALPAK